ncbi:MAG: hypothetical protein H7177_10835 [Rhizobacter sp.]|nr:hypothetical protein [Bacteriovorax sp.]
MKRFLILLMLAFFWACSAPVKQPSGHVGTEGLTSSPNKHNKVWIKKYQFSSFQDALDYALDRRLLIQRFHQLRSEPYFGTPNAKECGDNIDVRGDISTIKDGKYFFMKVLANDNRALGDCLKENNTQNSYYEFFICIDGTVTEARSYWAYNEAPPEKQNLKCGGL